MQLRVTVALATVWLTVAVLIGGAVTLRLSHDQYSPASPRRHARIQRDHTRDWRDHDSAEDQPLDLWIGSRRSISAEESEAPPRNAKFTERDFPLESLSKDIVSSKRIYPFSGWQRRLPNIVGTEFAADKVDYGYEMPETLSRETVVSPSDLLDDPFVADDTFQDQGPGSMEIYKLDLSKEKTLLTATTPSTNLPSRNKSKAPKKTDHLNSKTKATEIKSTTINANISHKQSNFFEEQLTETPLVNRDAFGVGGVPELQVGCEGLEASLSSHKAKRSIDMLDKEKGSVPASLLLDVTPVSLDLDDVLSYDEEEYEEMDELLKLKKLEIFTEKNKPNRGDMDASHLNSDHLDEFRRPEKLPVRGDLGKSTPTNSSKFITDQKKLSKRSLTDFQTKNYEETKSKRESVSLDDDGASRSHGRRLLWFAETNTEGFADGKSERKRTRRSIDWGFGEDEGVVSSDELQTVNERRRQHEMRYHQDTSKRRNQHHGLNTDDIRQQYEKLLEQQRREEQLRQMQQANRRTLSRWEEEEKRRRDEMRRRQYEEYRKRIDLTSTPRTDDEEIRQMEEQHRQEVTRNRTQEMARRNEEELRRRDEEERRRRLQEEETRRRPQSKWQEENLKSDSRTSSRNDEERKRRLHDEEMRRREEEWRRLEEVRKQEQYGSQQEAQRKREEEERRRQEDSMRNLSEDDRRRLEERRREWSEKRKQDNENEKRRQQPPSNLMRPEHPVSQPNDIRQRDQDEKRRQQEEREREQKLREYIARNRPINVNRADRRLEEERRHYRPEENRDPRMNVNRNDEEYRRRMQEQRRKEEEERKLQDYIRRNQPVNMPSKDNQSIAAGRNWFEERRLIEETRHRDRHPDPGVRKVHGPSAPTYIDPRSSPEEVRRRQQETARRLDEEQRQRQYEAEERRKEHTRQWEQERERLREERMRKEAARREEEARRTQSRKYEEDRERLEVARIQTERRRQEMLKERSRNEAGRTRQPEATRPIYYQNPHLLAEHRRRQDSQPIPSNLMRAEEARRAAAEHERQRLEVERRQQEESRIREDRQKESDQWKRQELARLNSLPVKARIIVHPGSSLPMSPISPRGSFDNEIDFTGFNPYREGVQVAQFPASPTLRPPIEAPSPCVWAVVHCCSSNNNRLVKCFESLGCPGTNWDPDPCRGPIAEAARKEVLKFYANA